MPIDIDVFKNFQTKKQLINSPKNIFNKKGYFSLSNSLDFSSLN